MSTRLLDALKQQADGLTPQEKSQFAKYLLEHANQGEPQLSSSDEETDELKRQQRAEWLKAHRAEYGGQYVALDGDRLLGTGRNYPEALAAARHAGANNAYVDYVAPPDAEGSIGGQL